MMTAGQSVGGKPAGARAGWACGALAVLPAAVLVLVVYLATLAVSSPDGFWTTDDANKFLQTRAVLLSDNTGLAIPWPGHSIDPSYEFNPIPPPFTRIQDGRMYSIFPPFFATVSSFFYQRMGYAGLYVLPVLAGFLLLVGIGRIAFALTASAGIGNLAVIFAGLCTPVWFYSVVFWEHVVAASFCVWSIFFFLRFLKEESLGDLVAGSILLAPGIYFRDELYLFAGVVVLSVACFSKTRKIAIAVSSSAIVLVAMIPLWVFQSQTIASPLGYHLGNYFLSASNVVKHILDRPEVVYNLFLAANPGIAVSLLLSAPFVVALLLNPEPSGKFSHLVVPSFSLAALVCSVVYFASLRSADSVIMYLLQTCNSFFVAAPIIVLGCFRLRRTEDPGFDAPRIRWLWFTFAVYAMLYGLAAQSGGLKGIHWGNRYVLVLYPLLGLLGAISVAAWHRNLRPGRKVLILPVVLLVLASFALQVFSIGILCRKKAFSSRLNREVGIMKEKVFITDQWWAAQEMCSQFYNKMFFFVRSAEDFDELSEKLARGGHTRFVYAASLSGEQGPNPILEVRDTGLNFYGLRFHAGAIDAGAQARGPTGTGAR